MKNKFSTVKFRSLLFVTFLLLTTLQMFSQSSTPFSINNSPLASPTSPVTDDANVLDANAKAALEKRIIDFRNTSNPRVELAVAIVNTTGERPIFDYSLAVARGWGIGSKETDNPSALLLIAIDDRKYFTQVSKDLEDELPDGLIGQLQRQYLVPAFRQQDYGKGISDTIDAYIRQIQVKQTGAPAPTVQPQERTNKRNESSLSGGACCLIILVIFLIIIFSRGGRAAFKFRRRAV